MLRPKTRLFAAASAVACIAALLSGCATSSINPTEDALQSDTLGLKGPSVAPANDWWRSLNDPQLDRIMTDALDGNPTLDVALDRFRLASAAVNATHAGLLPQIGIDGEEDRSRLSGHYEIPPPYAGTDRWVGATEASLSWTMDFAGKERALVSQARRTAEAATLDVAAARVVLTGAVAQTYVGLARADLQIRIAQAFVGSREEGLALARTRQVNNLSSDFDVRAAETLLAEAHRSLDKAKGERALMIHALAALAGRGADAYADAAAPTLSLDAALPLPASLPANLLNRRPDILAARARIEAADAGRKAAKADFYPSVDLRALLGVSAIGLSTLLTNNALTYGAGPAVHLAVFEGGRLRAQYRAATAEVDAATASYNALVLRAVQEAADALSSVQSTAAEAADQRKVQVGLTQTVRLDQVRVRSGLGTQLDILSSGDRLLEARQAQADLDAEGLIRRVQLLIAVGGDFTPISRFKLASTDVRGANSKVLP